MRGAVDALLAAECQYFIPELTDVDSMVACVAENYDVDWLLNLWCEKSNVERPKPTNRFVTGPYRPYLFDEKGNQIAHFEGEPADGEKYAEAKEILTNFDSMLQDKIADIEQKGDDPLVRRDLARYLGAVLLHKEQLDKLVPMPAFLSECTTSRKRPATEEPAV